MPAQGETQRPDSRNEPRPHLCQRYASIRRSSQVALPQPQRVESVLRMLRCRRQIHWQGEQIHPSADASARHRIFQSAHQKRTSLERGKPIPIPHKGSHTEERRPLFGIRKCHRRLQNERGIGPRIARGRQSGKDKRCDYERVRSR